ncbi:MAG: amidohydrolase family protein [Chloroflexi bacterium]|nr:amidohydrolase family protein [Chloroflexota bacterium]
MRSIDIHAHLEPQCFQKAMREGKTWHGITADDEEADLDPMEEWTPDERIRDMDSLGVDVQVVSTSSGFYQYHQEAATTLALARDCNNEVHQMTLDHPDRFKGFATLPMQDPSLAIEELDRAVNRLGLVGAMIDDHVNGKTYDEPEFLPFWKAAEQMGALIFIHQGAPTVVESRIDRYHLPNTIGNPANRAITFASFVFGGVMDTCPDLKICLAHGGGYTCFGIGRMDRGWQVRSEARININQPPSTYLRRFYYDCLTHSEAALRYLIDTVGVDRVVFGTDWPADMRIDWSASWVLGLESLSQDEKEAILWKNLEGLLGI